MGALQDYFDFVTEYAPYFYYIPGSGVDPEWEGDLQPQLHYLRSNGYIARIVRGICQITPEGKKYHVLLTS
jgi:hypothetical protein